MPLRPPSRQHALHFAPLRNLLVTPFVDVKGPPPFAPPSRDPLRRCEGPIHSDPFRPPFAAPFAPSHLSGVVAFEGGMFTDTIAVPCLGACCVGGVFRPTCPRGFRPSDLHMGEMVGFWGECAHQRDKRTCYGQTEKVCSQFCAKCCAE